ncbi:hypothetical protein HAX54_017431 [Datura stramonium]|uniref:Uncharacterized protein n=1 Tax=Datura stramonium TaxID=4076 RepID=A0ABS8UMV7_DATST|nr:hypothetical protein [Datura stramonium]
MENRSLDIWLHSKKRLNSASGSAPHLVLEWPKRLQIAIGAACNWAWRHLQKGKLIADALDEDIKETHYFDEICTVFKLGLFNTFPSSRPTMKKLCKSWIQCNSSPISSSGEHDVLPLLNNSRRERIEENDHTGCWNHDYKQKNKQRN